MKNIAKNTKIPKIFHYIWFGGALPEEISNRIERIKNLYPNYKVIIWDESNIQEFKTRNVVWALENEKWALASDILRISILYKYGGIYLDTDIEPIKKLDDEMLNHNVVLCIEYRYTISTGFIAAKKENKFIGEIMNIYSMFDSLNKNSDKDIVPINTEIFTYWLIDKYDLKKSVDKDQLLKDDIKIYKHTYFNSYRVHNNTYFIHKHDLSWTSNVKKRLMFFGLASCRVFPYMWYPALPIVDNVLIQKTKKRIEKGEKFLDETNEIDLTNVK